MILYSNKNIEFFHSKFFCIFFKIFKKFEIFNLISTIISKYYNKNK